MKYGYFDDSAREYVITNPRTPYPWINYLGSQNFFSLISNTAGGYSFYKDARLRRITRYRYNNVPIDSGGKYLYIREGDVIWSPGWKPVRTELDSYECHHGLGYTRIKGVKNDLEAEVLYFVPVNFNGEVQKLKLKNHGTAAKSFKVFSFVEWNLWNAFDDMTNFQRNFSTGEVEIDGSVIYHKTEYKERRNHYAFYAVNSPISGFDTDRDAFIGLYNGFENPDVVSGGKSRNSVAHGWSPIASHCLEVHLNPGEEKELVFLLGYIENSEEEKFEMKGVINKTKALSMIDSVSTPDKVRAMFDGLRGYWDNLLSVFQVKSSDEKMDRVVNIWNQYQCMVTFCMSRSASYFESGIGRGMGFRDSNQDLIGFVHQIPAKARERILDIAATQFEDGGAYHQYQPLTKRGNNEVGGNFNDDPLWLILSTSAYIKETGDWNILDDMVPFDNDTMKAAPLLDHLRRSFNHVVNNLGPHKLPLIGRADWNDCLNLNCFSYNPDEPFQTTENRTGGQAESIFIGGMFILYGAEYEKILLKLGKTSEALEARKHIDAVESALDDSGWDGEWFLRAYDYFGRKVGTNETEEGKIFIEPQGMCIMAGIGVEDGRARRALESVKERLACDYGIVLNNPAFTKYYIEYGEISTYPAGYKENAGVFCHNNPWIMIAETMLGNGEMAFDYWRRIAPPYLEEISDLHKTEPYVYAQMIAGKDAFKPGEAKNSWLSGTASWTFYAITQYILGIRPDYDGLVVDPCIPKSWDGFVVRRKFRGANYAITVRNPDHVSRGVKKVAVDGKEIPGDILPMLTPDGEHDVQVVMG